MLQDGKGSILQSWLSCLSNFFRNELHAIVDEVYMLSVFDESVTFCSVLSLERYGCNLNALLYYTPRHRDCKTLVVN